MVIKMVILVAAVAVDLLLLIHQVLKDKVVEVEELRATVVATNRSSNAVEVPGGGSVRTTSRDRS